MKTSSVERINILEMSDVEKQRQTSLAVRECLTYLVVDFWKCLTFHLQTSIFCIPYSVFCFPCVSAPLR